MKHVFGLTALEQRTMCETLTDVCLRTSGHEIPGHHYGLTGTITNDGEGVTLTEDSTGDQYHGDTINEAVSNLNPDGLDLDIGVYAEIAVDALADLQDWDMGEQEVVIDYRPEVFHFAHAVLTGMNREALVNFSQNLKLAMTYADGVRTGRHTVQDVSDVVSGACSLFLSALRADVDNTDSLGTLRARLMGLLRPSTAAMLKAQGMAGMIDRQKRWDDVVDTLVNLSTD